MKQPAMTAAPGTRRVPRRRTLSIIITWLSALATSIALPLAVAAPAAAIDPGGQEEPLPSVPSPNPSVPSIGTTVMSDGTPVGIVVAGGDGGLLHIVDLNNRTVISREQLAPPNTDVQPWEFARLSNRHVLLASGGGQLFEIDPDAAAGQKVTNLSDPTRPGYEQVAAYSKFLWDVVVDEHDQVYVATQSDHGGHILRYDPTANEGKGQWTDLLPGGIQAGETEVRSLAYEAGMLYAGTGTKSPAVYRIDTSTNTSTKLSVPGDVTAGLTRIERLEVKAGNLYIGTNVPREVRPTCGGTCVLDPSTGAQKTKDGKPIELETWSSKVVTRPGETEKVSYSVLSDNKPTLKEYDPQTNTSQTLAEGLASEARPSQSSWATHDRFISAGMNDGSISIVNASEGSAAGLTKDADGKTIEGSPRIIQSLTAVPGGDLYGSWYMTAPALLHVTPAAQANGTTYSLPKTPEDQQVEGFGQSRTWFVTGNYPSGELVRYPMGPDGPTLSQQPQSFPIGSDQARPYSIVPINEDQFAVGSTPKNKTGTTGAISVFNAAAGTVATYSLDEIAYADPSLQGSLSGRRPLSIVHHDGKLYVGTSASGDGMNADQTEADAPRLFEFDLDTAKVTRVMTPFKDQRSITALTSGSDGTLYGTTGTHVFTVNPADFTIGRDRSLTRGYADANRSQLLERDGVLYGIMGGRLWALDTSLQDDGTVIADSLDGPQGKVYVNALTLGADRNLYYARGATIYRYTFPAG